MIPNALTIDVEDYYSVMARDRLGLAMVPTEAVVRNTGRLLALLADRRIKATFFILGEVGEVFPRLVRDMAAGHEGPIVQAVRLGDEPAWHVPRPLGTVAESTGTGDG